MKQNNNILKYNELQTEIINAIKNVKQNNYKNYFENGYNKQNYDMPKISKLIKPLKNYKD